MAVLLASLLVISCSSRSQSIILATTTSTQDSGLLEELVPIFQNETGIQVKTIAVGTGQALEMGRRGDADILLVHAPGQEEEFMTEGHGALRQSFMYNDYVILGPKDDPAEIAESPSIPVVMQQITSSENLFLSRGDNSGTHFRERKLWADAGIHPQGAWYQETGQGMGQTLIVASEKLAYTLCDRSTYLAMQDKIDLVILFENDQVLHNIYSIITIDPGKSTSVNNPGAEAFYEFMLSKSAKEIIERFGIDRYGQPLFHLLNS